MEAIIEVQAPSKNKEAYFSSESGNFKVAQMHTAGRHILPMKYWKCWLLRPIGRIYKTIIFEISIFHFLAPRLKLNFWKTCNSKNATGPC